MESSTLNKMISALEYGTRLHISVVFQSGFGNRETRLPQHQKIHTCPVCDAAKETPEGLAACFRCRSTVLKWCIRHQRPLGGLCRNGVYEYCRPVLRGGETAAVIFIGNILREGGYAGPLAGTMEPNFSTADCLRIADVLESCIGLLLEKYGDTPDPGGDALLENIRDYLEENLLLDLSMAELASVFGYNEKYLGRLFKAKTGLSVKEYCNRARIGLSKKLLTAGSLPVAEVATRSGFNNITYFNRVFRRITGLSPGQYRGSPSEAATGCRADKKSP